MRLRKSPKRVDICRLKRGSPRFPDRALQEAQEIFGGDFDFAEFDADAYDQGEEEEEDQDEEGWDRPKKQTKRRQGRKSIFELYEPSELESSHMTDQDNEIRSTDMPERFQVNAAFGFCVPPPHSPGRHRRAGNVLLYWLCCKEHENGGL